MPPYTPPTLTFSLYRADRRRLLAMAREKRDRSTLPGYGFYGNAIGQRERKATQRDMALVRAACAEVRQ